MPAIGLSIFDLFKVGPGPSSSHTLGPMWAGYHFRRQLEALPPRRLAQATGLEVVLYGSLSATGRGHRTDRAVLAGLLGQRPDQVDPTFLAGLDAADRPLPELRLGERVVPLGWESIRFGPVEHSFPHSNTLVIRLLGSEGELYSQTYYSVGGGFIEWEDRPAPRRGKPVYAYANMAQLLELLQKEDIDLTELMLANEQAITGASREEIGQGLELLLERMLAAVERGLAASGPLPGPLGLMRKAPVLYAHAAQQRHRAERLVVQLNAYALAVAEENAAGSIVVTAPTLGSAGVIPAVLRLLSEHRNLSQRRLAESLLAAAAVGFVIKHNASIAGAEVGCQGEIGSATAMAAALLCQAHDRPAPIMAAAAEIALEHNLGLTCDPVMGYVQIPCIERNAMGAAKAYNAFLLASAGQPELQKVSLDQVVEAMLRTGRDMEDKYKETSQGGLALCLTRC